MSEYSLLNWMFLAAVVTSPFWGYYLIRRIKKATLIIAFLLVPTALLASPKPQKVVSGKVEHVIAFERPRVDCILYHPASQSKGAAEWACPVIQVRQAEKSSPSR